jgi:hypothetical protein
MATHRATSSKKEPSIFNVDTSRLLSKDKPTMEILDTNIPFQIGVEDFLCPASHP